MKARIRKDVIGAKAGLTAQSCFTQVKYLYSDTARTGNTCMLAEVMEDQPFQHLRLPPKFT